MELPGKQFSTWQNENRTMVTCRPQVDNDESPFSESQGPTHSHLKRSAAHISRWQAFCEESKLEYRMTYPPGFCQASLRLMINFDMELIRKLGRFLLK